MKEGKVFCRLVQALWMYVLQTLTRALLLPCNHARVNAVSQIKAFFQKYHLQMSDQTKPGISLRFNSMHSSHCDPSTCGLRCNIERMISQLIYICIE